MWGILEGNGAQPLDSEPIVPRCAVEGLTGVWVEHYLSQGDENCGFVC